MKTEVDSTEIYFFASGEPIVGVAVEVICAGYEGGRSRVSRKSGDVADVAGVASAWSRPCSITQCVEIEGIGAGRGPSVGDVDDSESIAGSNVGLAGIGARCNGEVDCPCGTGEGEIINRNRIGGGRRNESC